MKKIILLICIFPVFIFSNEIKVPDFKSVFDNQDSSKIFTYEQLLRVIFANHPTVKQADLVIDNAQAELRKSRGNFDPKISADWDFKDYKNTEYYDKIYSELKIPLWLPLDPKITFNRNTGKYINPEYYISEGDNYQQVTVGLSLPLGKGLFIDDRRAAVKQAQIYNQISEAERIKIINKVLFSATKDYWTWFFNYYEYQIQLKGLSISEEIYRRTKLNFEFGEASVLDTVQASITLQNRKANLLQAKIDFTQSAIMLSNYIWNEKGEPLLMNIELVPGFSEFYKIPDNEEFRKLKQNLSGINPEIRKLALKQDQLEIQRRLNLEYFKPQIDLNYNLINEPIGNTGEILIPELQDVKFGLNFSFPLYLRKERAELAKTNIKIQENEFEFDLLNREISNELDAAFFELNNARELLELLEQNVKNYEILFAGELVNLENGESDLFKINIQQDKLLEAQTKLIKAYSNIEKAKANFYMVSGVPYLNYNFD